MKFLSHRNEMRRILVLVLAVCVNQCFAQNCLEVPEPATLTGLHEIIDRSSRWAPICPFTITGSTGCDTQDPYRLKDTDFFLQVICVNNPGESHGCKIDCAGTHFEVKSGKIMFLNGFEMSGATKGSVKVKQGATMISKNNRYRNNKNFGGLDDDWSGAAIHSYPGSRLQLQNDDYRDNVATVNGGALYIESFASVVACTFVGNSASDGGGIYIANGSQRTNVVQSTFASNSAPKGASISIASSNTSYHSAANLGCDNNDLDGCNGAIVMQAGIITCRAFSGECGSPTAYPTPGE